MGVSSWRQTPVVLTTRLICVWEWYPIVNSECRNYVSEARYFIVSLKHASHNKCDFFCENRRNNILESYLAFKQAISVVTWIVHWIAFFMFGVRYGAIFLREELWIFYKGTKDLIHSWSLCILQWWIQSLSEQNDWDILRTLECANMFWFK